MDTDLPLLSGLLACDKPLGITSRDCVNHVERLLRVLYPKPARLPKVGHAGTLDPLASGVLMMGIGSGVRLVPYIQQLAKHYHATFQLGWWTESGDLDGELNEVSDAHVPTVAELNAAAVSLTGQITQVPPSTSAIRVGGKKAYKYAHQGIAVDVPPRVVRVDSLVITRYQYPEVDLAIECGGGTYVRTLGMDLAVHCRTRAVMTRLVRTQIGDFDLADCHSLADLTSESIQSCLLPLTSGVTHLPRLELDVAQTQQVGNGSKIDCAEVGVVAAEGTEATAIDQTGRLRAIVRKTGNRWCPYRVFHHRVS